MKTSGLLLTCIVLLVLISGSQGLQVSINRTPGNAPCGHLKCLNDDAHDGNIFITIAMTIYDITQPGTNIKIASVSGSKAGFSINPAKINEVNGTGRVSRYHSELTLDFHNETDCVYGSFQCELEFVNMAGQIEFSREITTSESSSNGCSCSILTYQVSKLTSRVDQVEKDVTDLTLNNTILESELVYLRQQVEKEVTDLTLNNTILESELVYLRQQVEKDVTDLTLNNTILEAELVSLRQQVEKEVTDLTLNNTILESELVYLRQQVEKDVTDLTLNNTILESELVYLKQQVEKDVTDLTLNNTILESELVYLRQQVEKDVTDLTLNNTILESELVSLRQQNNLLVLQFDALSRQVSIILNSVTTPNPPIVTSTQQISVLGAGTKGTISTNPREKFMLLSQVLAMCHTETDGAGLVIIQNRTKGDIDFYKNWNDYKNGFGTPDTDFWIRNDRIRNLTSQLLHLESASNNTPPTMKDANGLSLTCLALEPLVSITQEQSLDLTVKRTPGQTTCASLRCSAKAPTNGSIFALTKLTIYDITDANTRNRIAYKVQDEDLFINSTKISDVTGTAYWSKYHANLTLNFQNETDCLNGKFQCELKSLTVQGQPTYISKNSTNDDTNACCTIAIYKLSQLQEQNDALQNKTSKLETELTSLKQQNEEMKNREILLRKTCLKGNVHTSPREKFLPWGSVEALCDTETNGGGWVIIQRRTNSDVIFKRNWQDYKTGFGNITTNFWFGLDNIHNLTSRGYTVLRVDMEYQGKKYFAQYSTFRVGDELSKYQLTVSGYTGTAADALSYHNGMKFSTYDQDNDIASSNCASKFHGAWWYNDCHHSNLNGIWASNDISGLCWNGVIYPGSVSFSEMKVRHV